MNPSTPIVGNPTRLSLEQIARASAVIDRVFLDSPQFEAPSLSALLGCRLTLKIEMLNPIGSFKARGAYLLLSQLSGRPRLVCATAGNFGQGMAHAAKSYGLSLTVFTGAQASPIKVARMRSLGADVRFSDTEQGAQEAARAFAENSGAMLIEDGRQPAIAEGAGSIAVELLRGGASYDFVVVPVGDGALLGGVARWVKAHCPTTQIIGVCAAGAPAMQLSWRTEQVQTTAPPDTIAAGLAIQSPHAESLADLCALADDIVLVDDDALIRAMQVAHRELGLVLEPSGAAGLAALREHSERFRGSSAATVLTGGGNLTRDQMQNWLSCSR